MAAINPNWGRSAFRDPAVIAVERARGAADAAARDASAPGYAEFAKAITFSGHTDLHLEDPIGFEVAFDAEPMFSVGVGLLALPDPAWWRFPQVTGFLRSWVQDARGLFVGARVSVAVFIPAQPVLPEQGTAPAPTCTCVLQMKFSGIAVKTVDTSGGLAPSRPMGGG